MSDISCQKLPYGGVYLVGGVTQGLHDFIRDDSLFMDVFNQDGRAKQILGDVPVLLVRPDIQLGILGSEEACYREL